MEVISRFTGEYEFLSNFYWSTVEYLGFAFPTAEHAFQAARVTDPDVRERIAYAKTPRAAKAAGRTVRLRPNWEEVKESVMLDVLRAKFRNGALPGWLLATGDALLVEGNTWGDTYWGVCDGRGRNVLGYLLMEVRAELKAEMG